MSKKVRWWIVGVVAAAGLAFMGVAALSFQAGPAVARTTAEQEFAATGDPDRAVRNVGDLSESDEIEGRADWMWNRLTYPAGTLPQGDWRGKALAHVKANVPDGAPAGSKKSPAAGGVRDASLDGAKGAPSAVAGGESVQTDQSAVVPVNTAAWTAIGPQPLDSLGTSNNAYQYGVVSGRINALAFANATTAYAGATVGGLWKTTNCCSASTTWVPLWDDANFAAQSVGAIAIDPTNANVIYVGTGDSQPPAGDMYGNGVFKSTDGGATWTQLGANLFSPYGSAGAPAVSCCALAPDQNIKAIAVNPNNPNTVFVGASYGLFVSYNGGTTWTQLDIVNRNAAPYNDDAQRIDSILIDGPSNTMYVSIGYPYASGRRPGLTGGANGIYKATVPASGSPTWTAVNGGLPTGTGNGTPNDVGRVELTWNANHTRLYAMISNYGTSNASKAGMALGLYTKLTSAANWTLLSGTAETLKGTRLTTSWKQCGSGSDEGGQQDWYNLYVAVDPLNDKILYVGRVSTYKVTVGSTYASATILNLGNVYGQTCTGYSKFHPDQHAFAFVPGSNPSTFLAGNDGGVYFGTGAVGGFTQLNNSLSTLQFYAGQIGANFGQVGGAATQYAFGGMQDNGNASFDSVTNSGSNLKWTARGTGGDGFFTAFDVLGGSITAGTWLEEYTYGQVGCSTTGADGPYTTGTTCSPAYSTAEREDWSTPFMLDQWNCTNANCNNLVLGSTRVWASVTSLAGVKPTWVAASPTTVDLTKNLGSSSTIIALNVAHKRPGTVIVGTSDGNVQISNNVFTGANCTAAAANTASFACTVNTASTWSNLTAANAVLPNRVINGVAIDPNYDGANLSTMRVYAAVGGFNTNTPATPGHLFMGQCANVSCSSVTWTNKTSSLPDIPFQAVEVNPSNTNQVFVGTALGFYYTNDISAASPVWNRFQTGMPNTMVQFLAVDRGPASAPYASTTLAAFTYGRGAYVVSIGLP